MLFLILVNVTCSCEEGDHDGCSAQNHKACEDDADYSDNFCLLVHNSYSYVNSNNLLIKNLFKIFFRNCSSRSGNFYFLITSVVKMLGELVRSSRYLLTLLAGEHGSSCASTV